MTGKNVVTATEIIHTNSVKIGGKKKIMALGRGNLKSLKVLGKGVINGLCLAERVLEPKPMLCSQLDVLIGSSYSKRFSMPPNVH